MNSECGLDQDVASKMERSRENCLDQIMDRIWERREMQSHRWMSEWKRCHKLGLMPGRKTTFCSHEGEWHGCENLTQCPGAP